MWRWITAAVVGIVALGILMAPAAQAAHLPGKTIVLLGSIGRNAGETPWQLLREQLGMRGFPASDVVEFQYAGGSFGPDGSYTPNPGGQCESYSKMSFLALQQLMGELKQLKPDNEVFLVGHGVGGFVATQALWGVAAQSPEMNQEAWTNLSGIVSISGPMAGLSSRRTPFEFANAGRLGCVDPSMVAWMEEVGDPPERFAIVEQRAALVTQQLGYKIGSFGNTVDCAYFIASRDVCPKTTEIAGGRGILLQLLGDERLTMFAKTGTLWKEYNLTSDFEGDVIDNHSAVLLHTQPMAEVAEFVLSQSR
jgi:pimeloyl-ACP methyl ester carboxylesterase